MTASRTAPVAVGVVGVGHMGRHHARVYRELPAARLVGVTDADPERADTVAAEYDTEAMGRAALLDRVDAVSVAVPTPYHAETVRACLEADVDVLVEKPFVDDRAQGEALAALADERDRVLQVGHIERFNPATRVLADIVPDLDVVAVDIDRLGPPLARENGDSVVADLMIHDLDVLRSLVPAPIEQLSAVAHDRRHVTAQFRFANDAVATLTASRLTQQKVRQCSVTARSCRVTVDFISQHVEIHRRSLPEYVETNGDVRYRHEQVIEQPTVENGEPLRAELDAFCEAVATRSDPLVTAADGLAALDLVERIERAALGREAEVTSA